MQPQRAAVARRRPRAAFALAPVASAAAVVGAGVVLRFLLQSLRVRHALRRARLAVRCWTRGEKLAKRARVSGERAVVRDHAAKLDGVRDHAVAQLENERIMNAVALSDDEFALLPPLQRRELLAVAFERTFKGADRSVVAVAGAVAGRGVSEMPVASSPGKATVAPGGSKLATGAGNAGWDNATLFWKMAESANGRAAAIGFVLCLMREVLEPGHPSLFEQVVDVVVPIAQSTPPFLVAVVDALADLLI